MNDGAMCSGGRQRGCFDRGTLAVRVHKIQPLVETDFVAGADARIKVSEIRAAAESYVLAIIHFAAVWQRVGSGASTKVGTLFQQTNARPASASATAEDSPARPPPITRTLCEGITLPSAGSARREARRQEILDFFGIGKRNARTEDVEIAFFDSGEQAAVRANQRPESGAAVRIHLLPREARLHDTSARRGPLRIRANAVALP